MGRDVERLRTKAHCNSMCRSLAHLEERLRQAEERHRVLSATGCSSTPGPTAASEYLPWPYNATRAENFAVLNIPKTVVSVSTGVVTTDTPYAGPGSAQAQPVPDKQPRRTPVPSALDDDEQHLHLVNQFSAYYNATALNKEGVTAFTGGYVFALQFRPTPSAAEVARREMPVWTSVPTPLVGSRLSQGLGLGGKWSLAAGSGSGGAEWCAVDMHETATAGTLYSSLPRRNLLAMPAVRGVTDKLRLTVELQLCGDRWDAAAGSDTAPKRYPPDLPLKALPLMLVLGGLQRQDGTGADTAWRQFLLMTLHQDQGRAGGKPFGTAAGASKSMWRQVRCRVKGRPDLDGACEGLRLKYGNVPLSAETMRASYEYTNADSMPAPLRPSPPFPPGDSALPVPPATGRAAFAQTDDLVTGGQVLANQTWVGSHAFGRLQGEAEEKLAADGGLASVPSLVPTTADGDSLSGESLLRRLKVAAPPPSRLDGGLTVVFDLETDGPVVNEYLSRSSDPDAQSRHMASWFLQAQGAVPAETGKWPATAERKRQAAAAAGRALDRGLITPEEHATALELIAACTANGLCPDIA